MACQSLSSKWPGKAKQACRGIGGPPMGHRAKRDAVITAIGSHLNAIGMVYAMSHRPAADATASPGQFQD
jgi:hypothetical protein